jgi:hypothetical protein
MTLRLGLPSHGGRGPAIHDFAGNSAKRRGWPAGACPRAGFWPDPWADHDGVIDRWVTHKGGWHKNALVKSSLLQPFEHLVPRLLRAELIGKCLGIKEWP